MNEIKRELKPMNVIIKKCGRLLSKNINNANLQNK